jgi:hypothetical protein
MEFRRYDPWISPASVTPVAQDIIPQHQFLYTDHKVVYSSPVKEAIQSLERSIHTVCTVQELWAHLPEEQKCDFWRWAYRRG